MSAWYTKGPETVLAELKTSRDLGLSHAQAQKRLEQYGPNALEQQKRPSVLIRLLGQMKDPMTLILLAAAVLSFFASGMTDWVEPVIILVIVAVNSILSILQEDHAQQALEQLRKMSAPNARVLRQGKERVIPAVELVPGDVILVETGDQVPADARIIQCSRLQADESALTGESVPVIC